MEKQTMKVMYYNGDSIYEVYEKPLINKDNKWCFETVNGNFMLIENCTPVPEKTETDLERERSFVWNVFPAGSLKCDEPVVKLDNCKANEKLYESAISRLTAGEWSTDDMVDCWMASAKRELTLLAYLAARRKEKEGKV